ARVFQGLPCCLRGDCCSEVHEWTAGPSTEGSARAVQHLEHPSGLVRGAWRHAERRTEIREHVDVVEPDGFGVALRGCFERITGLKTVRIGIHTEVLRCACERCDVGGNVARGAVDGFRGMNSWIQSAYDRIECCRHFRRARNVEDPG